ncbi:hypothetical protein BO83DRAFT_206335 [Aspergillus eucalypticola CBS 122712]|uniref:Uncharacterized protein n=1 Tax=Aspergillus eucalypticola (strain CBS 122712 / IBT 29274) TaxID=1448314 RepID=A0A317W176_ASPEC|nr:uncharacterized protein BO83DRAFT_206335 [Aspergillus eucalypticola CBS 122712]PWY80233.1 hypothetical protein BO83DRAFT_206335 [Aspergillus eucalypticola CBS 122712]
MRTTDLTCCGQPCSHISKAPLNEWHPSRVPHQSRSISTPTTTHTHTQRPVAFEVFRTPHQIQVCFISFLTFLFFLFQFCFSFSLRDDESLAVCELMLSVTVQSYPSLPGPVRINLRQPNGVRSINLLLTLPMRMMMMMILLLMMLLKGK